MTWTWNRKGITAAIIGLWQRRRPRQPEQTREAATPAPQSNHATEWPQLVDENQVLVKEVTQLRSAPAVVHNQQIETSSAEAPGIAFWKRSSAGALR